ncbi:MAG: carbohydrate ABC transporter permease [bacterium]
MKAIVNWWTRKQVMVAPYIFISPFFILFAVFFVFPVLYSLILSFFEAQGLGERTFIGLGNYIELFRDSRFLKAVFNTVYYSAGSVFILSPIALFLALALNSPLIPGRGFFRAAYFVPVITSAVVVAIMFLRVFDKDYGMLNAGLSAIGLPKVPWIRSARWAMPSMIILGIWTWAGINAVYFLGGLQGISGELREAAMIDGASAWQFFKYVTIPLLRPVILFVVVQAIIGSFNLFAQPLLLGAPEDSLLMLTIYMYIQGFSFFNLGYASAIAWAMAIIMLILSLLSLRALGFGRED